MTWILERTISVVKLNWLTCLIAGDFFFFSCVSHFCRSFCGPHMQLMYTETHTCFIRAEVCHRPPQVRRLRAASVIILSEENVAQENSRLPLHFLMHVDDTSASNSTIFFFFFRLRYSFSRDTGCRRRQFHQFNQHWLCEMYIYDRRVVMEASIILKWLVYRREMRTFNPRAGCAFTRPNVILVDTKKMLRAVNWFYFPFSFDFVNNLRLMEHFHETWVLW